MILDSDGLILIPDTHEDEGLMIYDETTRKVLYEHVIAQIEKNPNSILSQFFTNSQLNRDKVIFTLSIFGSCFNDGISAESSFRIQSNLYIFQNYTFSKTYTFSKK